MVRSLRYDGKLKTDPLELFKKKAKTFVLEMINSSENTAKWNGKSITGIPLSILQYYAEFYFKG